MAVLDRALVADLLRRVASGLTTQADADLLARWLGVADANPEIETNPETGGPDHA